MIDRFGLLPDVTQTLIDIAHLKLKVAPLGIKKVDIGKEYGSLKFDEKPNIDPVKMVALIQSQPQTYQLQGADKLRFALTADTAQQKIQALETTIEKLL